MDTASPSPQTVAFATHLSFDARAFGSGDAASDSDSESPLMHHLHLRQDAADLLARLRLERVVGGHARREVQLAALAARGALDELARAHVRRRVVADLLLDLRLLLVTSEADLEASPLN